MGPRGDAAHLLRARVVHESADVRARDRRHRRARTSALAARARLVGRDALEQRAAASVDEDRRGGRLPVSDVLHRGPWEQRAGLDRRRRSHAAARARSARTARVHRGAVGALQARAQDAVVCAAVRSCCVRGDRERPGAVQRRERAVHHRALLRRARANVWGRWRVHDARPAAAARSRRRRARRRGGRRRGRPRRSVRSCVRGSRVRRRPLRRLVRSVSRARSVQRRRAMLRVRRRRNVHARRALSNGRDQLPTRRPCVRRASERSRGRSVRGRRVRRPRRLRRVRRGRDVHALRRVPRGHRGVRFWSTDVRSGCSSPGRSALCWWRVRRNGHVRRVRCGHQLQHRQRVHDRDDFVCHWRAGLRAERRPQRGIELPRRRVRRRGSLQRVHRGDDLRREQPVHDRDALVRHRDRGLHERRQCNRGHELSGRRVRRRGPLRRVRRGSRVREAQPLRSGPRNVLVRRSRLRTQRGRGDGHRLRQRRDL
jgi:hypothetical protein